MTWRGWTAFVALGIIWGLPYFFIKVAVQEVSPSAPGVQPGALLATMILLPIAWRRGALRSLGRAQGGDLRVRPWSSSRFRFR